MLPRRTVTSLDRNRHRLTTRGDQTLESVVLDSTNTDAGNTPTFRFRPGNVVALRASTGRFVEANDANADAQTPAAVSALETADVDWQSTTISVTQDGGAVVDVALGAADDTDAEVVIALNADAQFTARYVADVFGGVVRIRSLDGGAGVSINVESTLASAFGAVGVGTSGVGTDPDIRITEHVVDLQDQDGTAINEEVLTSKLGDYERSQLLNLTAEAEAVLLRRGSIFK